MEHKEINVDEILSPRERQVFDFIAAGISPAEMASRLCLSPKTVSTYRSRILEKLSVKSNAQIAVLAQSKDTGALLALLEQAMRDFAVIAQQVGHETEVGKFAGAACLRIDENLRARSES